MSPVLSGEGFTTLRIPLTTLALAVVVAAGLALGGLWFLERERRDDAQARRQLAEAMARLDAARRESDDLRASAELFRDLVKRGILQEENRLEFVERLDALRSTHRLLGLEYEIAPQRPLPLAGGQASGTVDVLGSRVKVTAKALHEGDALAFIEDIAKPPRGFNPVIRCHIQRLEAGAANVLAPRVEAQCTLEWITLRDKRGSRAG
jgi:hypothetical protein